MSNIGADRPDLLPVWAERPPSWDEQHTEQDGRRHLLAVLLATAVRDWQTTLRCSVLLATLAGLTMITLSLLPIDLSIGPVHIVCSYRPNT